MYRTKGYCNVFLHQLCYDKLVSMFKFYSLNVAISDTQISVKFWHPLCPICKFFSLNASFMLPICLFFLFRKDTYFIHLYLFLHLWHYSLFNLLSTSFTAILCFLFSFFSCHYSVTCYWLWLKVFSFEAKNSFILHIFIVQTMWLLFSWGQGFIH